MKFSMNGFRRQLSADCETLKREVETILTGDHWDKQDLIDAVNQVITKSNVLNCVYHDGDSDFSDISEIEVELIEEQAHD